MCGKVLLTPTGFLVEMLRTFLAFAQEGLNAAKQQGAMALLLPISAPPGESPISPGTWMRRAVFALLDPSSISHIFLEGPGVPWVGNRAMGQSLCPSLLAQGKVLRRLWVWVLFPKMALLPRAVTACISIVHPPFRVLAGEPGANSLPSPPVSGVSDSLPRPQPALRPASLAESSHGL